MPHRAVVVDRYGGRPSEPVAVGLVLRQQPDEDEEEDEEIGDAKKHDEQDEEENEDDGFSVRLSQSSTIRFLPALQTFVTPP